LPGEREATSPCVVRLLRIAQADVEFGHRQFESLAHEYERVKGLLSELPQPAEVLAQLTPRQHQILELVLIGTASKNIAADLHISRRTVENHRAAIMKKTGAKSLPALGRICAATRFQEHDRIDRKTA